MAVIFTTQEDEKLANLVKQHRELYDIRHETYKDTYHKDNIWNEIAMELNKTEDVCKKRWKHIRDSYNRYKRKQKCTPGHIYKSKCSKWKFYEKISLFLGQDAGENVATSPCASDNNGFVSSNNSFVPQSDNEQTGSDNENNKHLERNRYRQLLKKRKDIRHAMKRNVGDKDTDDDTSFCNYIKSVLKVLPPRLRLEAKNDIFNTLAQYESKHLDMQEACVSSNASTASHMSTELEGTVKEEPLELSEESLNN